MEERMEIGRNGRVREEEKRRKREVKEDGAREGVKWWNGTEGNRDSSDREKRRVGYK